MLFRLKFVLILNVALKFIIFVIICLIFLRRRGRLRFVIFYFLLYLGRLFKIIVIFIFCWLLFVCKIISVVFNNWAWWRFWWLFINRLLASLRCLLLLLQFFFFHLFSDLSIDFILIAVNSHLFLWWIFRHLFVSPVKNFVYQIFVLQKFINSFDDLFNEK